MSALRAGARVEREAPVVARAETVLDGVVIRGYGKPYDWSLRRLQKAENAANQEELCERLDRVLGDFPGITTVFAPSPVLMNGLICEEESLKHEIVLPSGKVIRRGAEADAVELKPGQAYVVSSADCFTGVIKIKGRVFAVHIGRDSALNRKWIASHSSNSHPGVIDAIMRQFTHEERLRPSSRVFVGLGIGDSTFPHPLDHPEHATYNGQLVRHLLYKYGEGVFEGDPKEGRLRLRKIILEQLKANGILPAQVVIDAIDTIRDKKDWHSALRGEKSRNLVIVAHLQ